MRMTERESISQTEFLKQLRAGRSDFSSCDFDGTLFLGNMSLRKELSLAGAKIDGDLLIRRLKVPVFLNLRGIEVREEIIVTESKILGPLDFSRVNTGTVRVSDTKVDGYLDFHEAVVFNAVFLGSSHVVGQTSFNRAKIGRVGICKNKLDFGLLMNGCAVESLDFRENRLRHKIECGQSLDLALKFFLLGHKVEIDHTPIAKLLSLLSASAPVSS